MDLAQITAPWQACYSALLSYVQEHGHARPPQQTFADGIAIGQWVKEARRQHKAGRLPQSRAEQLEKLPGSRWNKAGGRGPKD